MYLLPTLENVQILFKKCQLKSPFLESIYPTFLCISFFAKIHKTLIMGRGDTEVLCQLVLILGRCR